LLVHSTVFLHRPDLPVQLSTWVVALIGPLVTTRLKQQGSSGLVIPDSANENSQGVSPLAAVVDFIAEPTVMTC
jgi:hypothetical protein